ncbi:MAG: hypothetical protein M3Z09_02855 [Acidobacteriota bacterium]|nr:hypothetical protein [Acidobacteriota bacterium]
MLPLLQEIEQFLAGATLPALLEPGEPILPLTDSNHSLEPKSSHVLLQAWEDHRNLSRRVVRAHQAERGKLELSVNLFGGREGKLLLLDLASPHTAEWRKRGRKLEFRERFRHFLTRQFPGWVAHQVSTETNLEQSLSPAFPRAFLKRGASGMAAIAAPPEMDDPSGILSFGLIWLKYLRDREPKITVTELLLLLPVGRETQTALRLRFLNQTCSLFVYGEDDEAAKVDPRDAGNLETVLATCHRGPAAPISAASELAQVPGFEQVQQSGETASLRIHGLEFARLPGPASAAELLAHARELSRLRREPGSLLHLKEPERWLESRVRARLSQVDPSLRVAPVYGQVPAFTGRDRGIADLLAAEHSGRLAVLELKASADLHLPLQALDYWMRVAKHAAAGDFTAAGFFPGIALSPALPKLLLVAPSLEFHSTAETILSFFLPSIEVQRIGLGANWRNEIRVMFRLNGADRP